MTKKSKAECNKPTPPGLTISAAKHAGKASGTASSAGLGRGWGRAHAPGQSNEQHNTHQENASSSGNN